MSPHQVGLTHPAPLPMTLELHTRLPGRPDRVCSFRSGPGAYTQGASTLVQRRVTLKGRPNNDRMYFGKGFDLVGAL